MVDVATATSPASPSKDGKPKIILHWLEDSRAQRIAWLLEELGLEYEIKPYKRINQLAPPELKAIHPLGKSPILTITTPSPIPDSPPSTIVLPESAFIVDYLTKQHQRLLPPPDADLSIQLQYQHLLHFAEGSLMPPLIIGHVLNAIKTAPVPFFIKPITNMIVSKVYAAYLRPTYEANFAFLEDIIKDRKFFLGEELTGVDILFSFPLLAAGGRVQGFDEEKYPGIYRWLEEIRKREAYKRAEERTKQWEGDLLK